MLQLTCPWADASAWLRAPQARRDWLSLVAVHSDSWLLAQAFFNGARLNREGRCVQAHIPTQAPARSLLPLPAGRLTPLAAQGGAVLPHQRRANVLRNRVWEGGQGWQGQEAGRAGAACHAAAGAQPAAQAPAPGEWRPAPPSWARFKTWLPSGGRPGAWTAPVLRPCLVQPDCTALLRAGARSGPMLTVTASGCRPCDPRAPSGGPGRTTTRMRTRTRRRRTAWLWTTSTRMARATPAPTAAACTGARPVRAASCLGVRYRPLAAPGAATAGAALGAQRGRIYPATLGFCARLRRVMRRPAWRLAPRARLADAPVVRARRTGEFWIACDFCDIWYDGKCVQARSTCFPAPPSWLLG